MTDQEKREKVIKVLEVILEETADMFYRSTIQDALALLKAQEAVEPTLDIRHGKSMWRCGSCSTALQPNHMDAKFCFNCGRAVKWWE